MAASQRIACLKVKLMHVGSAAGEQRLTQYCVYSAVSGSMVDVPG